MAKILLALSIILFGVFFIATESLAGGGPYNIQGVDGTHYVGQAVTIVVTVSDYSHTPTGNEPYKDEFGTPVFYNEEFKLVAHPESAGERCETYQPRTDTQGKFRGKCYSDEPGKFAFHVEPISKPELGNSPSIEVFFQAGSPSPTPTTQTSLSPSPVVKVTPTPKASVSPTPIKLSPSPVSSPTQEPSPTSTPEAVTTVNNPSDTPPPTNSSSFFSTFQLLPMIALVGGLVVIGASAFLGYKMYWKKV